ncbi:DUF4290 domain-containing protein [Adhaeribacter aquaticus]|uniref:DUF4290 domain-containing protein n=1 Tax=Adhaeribacter aquaticus TaxID=299567 RepID=UPI0004015E80|nr:DUF4290 domain-containing protein [Adhaeribacter aquaticus]
MVANSSFKQELLLREYGINVQNIVKYILTLPEKADRTRASYLLVNLMAKLNPSLREVQDSPQKLWNHLFVMSDGKLDIDSPYALSAMEYLNEKPLRMILPTRPPRYKHYGKNVEHLIQKAIEIEDPQEKEAAIIALGKLMKTLYKTYNRDNITDEIIVNNLKELSKGQLTIDLATVEANSLFESNARSNNTNYSNQNNQNNQRKKQQNNQNNQRKK